jgi:hypothetical protein
MSTFFMNFSVLLQNRHSLDFDSSQYANLLFMFAMMFQRTQVLLQKATFVKRVDSF